jgi:glycosyltransferase involved in cell wall biosynthesis
MKVVVVHNLYQQPGGEDEVFRAETDLLSSHGHTVVRYTVDNRNVGNMGSLALAAGAIWNKPTHRHLRELFRDARPDVVHFHNTHPLVSPAGYYAARAQGVAVVQTLHNFRLVCPSGVLFRDGSVCEECLGKPFPWPGIVHACYRGSRSATAVTAGMVSVHRALGTWSRTVGVFIALSEFSRRKFIAGGLPPEKIVVKPNFLMSDPGSGGHQGKFALFVGRLSPEKGLDVLQRAWGMLGRDFNLKIIGGPLTQETNDVTAGRIEWLGVQPKERVFVEMKEASFLIFPSECYENCPMTIIEAFATGLPVVVSGRGSAAGMVTDYQSGRHFRAGDPADLASKVEWALGHPDEMAAMGRFARQVFESVYTATENYARLMEIYRLAMAA